MIRLSKRSSQTIGGLTRERPRCPPRNRRVPSDRVDPDCDCSLSFPQELSQARPSIPRFVLSGKNLRLEGSRRKLDGVRWRRAKQLQRARSKTYHWESFVDRLLRGR